jgi:hypothetical protein
MKSCPSAFPTKMLYVFLIFLMRTTFSTYHNPTQFVHPNNIWWSTIHKAPYFAISLHRFWLSLASNTLFRILFLNTISYVSFHVLMAASTKMEALRTPETSVYFNNATRRYIPEGCQLYSFLTTYCTSIATRNFIDVSVLTFTVRWK